MGLIASCILFWFKLLGRYWYMVEHLVLKRSTGNTEMDGIMIICCGKQRFT